MSAGTVYLLHFNQRYRHAGHYLGWTEGELADRIADHIRGRGARLLTVVIAAGISFKLARTWSGGRKRERQLKRQGGAAALCPICRDLGQHLRGAKRRRQLAEAANAI